jgi:hypothetical protein
VCEPTGVFQTENYNATQREPHRKAPPVWQKTPAEGYEDNIQNGRGCGEEAFSSAAPSAGEGAWKGTCVRNRLRRFVTELQFPPNEALFKQKSLQLIRLTDSVIFLFNAKIEYLINGMNIDEPQFHDSYYQLPVTLHFLPFGCVYSLC